MLSTENTIVIAADDRKAYESENKGLEVKNDETIKLCEFGKTFVIGLAGCAKVSKNLQFRLRMMKKIGRLEATKNKVWGMLQNVTSMFEDNIEAILTGVQLVDGKRSVRIWFLDDKLDNAKECSSYACIGPSRFNVEQRHNGAEFCETATGRVALVDYGFWWIFLLRAYTGSTGDTMLAELPECQMAMQLILSLCLSEGFNTFPTLLCTDGCSMIERQMILSKEMAEDASLQSELVTTSINKHLREKRTGKSGGVISGKGELKSHGTTI
ncbi:Cytosolic invertase 1 [Linum perenne]